MAAHNELGAEGEELAAGYLLKNGYTILDRNWHCGRKELDIVARRDGQLVIVEVKSRTDSRFGSPEDSVTDRKIRRIVSSTDAYIRLNAIDLPVRFDIITVTFNDGNPAVEHIENAFFPPIWN